MQQEEDLTRYGNLKFHEQIKGERVADQVKELEAKQKTIDAKVAELEAIAEIKRSALDKQTMTAIGAGFFEKQTAKAAPGGNLGQTKNSQGFNSPRNITTGASNNAKVPAIRKPSQVSG